MRIYCKWRPKIDELANGVVSTRREYQPVPQAIYKPFKGDQMDQMFAKAIRRTGQQINLRRISEGEYLYGDWKVFTEVHQGELYIKTEGSYLYLVDDFFSLSLDFSVLYRPSSIQKSFVKLEQSQLVDTECGCESDEEPIVTAFNSGCES